MMQAINTILLRPILKTFSRLSLIEIEAASCIRI
ncbi:hypothetical protein NEOC95_001405 [Neochlamydia sp. AcF95]|nr:hypothetical protein [Neochlamydia sp. AcF95]